MKLTSSSVARGVMVSFVAESVVPTRVAPSQGKKKSTLGAGGERSHSGRGRPIEVWEQTEGYFGGAG